MDIVELAGMCGGFALLRCHVLPPVFLCLTHASAHWNLQFGNLGSLNLYLSSICTVNPQIYVGWQFAHSLDTRAELLREASPDYLHSRSRLSALY